MSKSKSESKSEAKTAPNPAGKLAPLKRVANEHQNKETLVDKIVGLVDRPEGEEAPAYRKRLLSASNTKLLRLYEASREVKERFGNKDSLVDKILLLLDRTRDKDLATKLRSWTPVRLRSLHASYEKKQH